MSLLCLLAALAPGLRAEEAVYRSGPSRVALLELYSSEGCSSTPPADRWLSSLQDRPGLWTSFVPVKFQVRMWDHLGWPDRFATDEGSERQRSLARAWGDGRVYTPEFAFAGEEWRGWFEGRGLPARAAADAGSLEARPGADGRVRVRYRAPGAGSWTARAALLGFGVENEVEGGENRGLRLRHDFLALAQAEAALAPSAGGDAQEAVLVLPAPSARPSRCALAVWVSRAGDPRPVQALGGPLPPSHCRAAGAPPSE